MISPALAWRLSRGLRLMYRRPELAVGLTGPVPTKEASFAEPFVENHSLTDLQYRVMLKAEPECVAVAR